MDLINPGKDDDYNDDDDDEEEEEEERQEEEEILIMLSVIITWIIKTLKDHYDFVIRHKFFYLRYYAIGMICIVIYIFLSTSCWLFSLSS